MLLRAVYGALVLWTVGVQLNEAVATIGAVLTTIGVAVVWFRGERHVDWRRWWLLPAFVCSGLLFPLLGGALPTAGGAARLVDWLLVPVAATAFATMNDQRRQRWFQVAVIVLTLSCLAAGLQHFGMWPAATFFEPVAFLKIPFWRVYEPVPEAEGRFLAGGLLFHRLKFANVSGALTLVLLGTYLDDVARRAWPAVLLLFCTLATVVFPSARAASAALFLGGLVFVLVHWTRPATRLRLVAGLVALFTLTLWLAPGLQSRAAAVVLGDERGDRRVLVEAGLRAVVVHPFTGVGSGRFHPFDYMKPDASESARSHQGKAHNQLLTMAAEGGGITALLFAAMLWSVFRGALAERRAVTAAVVSFFVALSALHDPLFHAETSLAVVLLLGLSLSMPGSGTSVPARDDQPDGHRKTDDSEALKVDSPGTL
jgi:O-antigen ligase